MIGMVRSGTLVYGAPEIARFFAERYRRGAVITADIVRAHVLRRELVVSAYKDGIWLEIVPEGEGCGL